MPKIAILAKRFDELTAQLAAVGATKRRSDDYDYVDDQLLTNWKVKARNLLSMACGPTSEHYADFVKAQTPTGWGTNYDVMTQLRAIFEAAKEDYEGGYLASVRTLVQAEVFSNELDQAQELLDSGYTVAAAVIAGVVLETALRQLCDDHGLATGKLDKMNADLTKAGCYTLLMQKRITALADIRNNAAHGHPDKFGKSDVQDMIKQVEAFLTDHL